MACVCKDKYDMSLRVGEFFTLDEDPKQLWDITELLPENMIKIVSKVNSEITKTVNAAEGFTIPF